MTFKDYLDLVGAVIFALGGGSAIVLAMSSWLGKLWADRIMENARSTHQKELESLKAEYQKHLEAYKSELDMAKLNYIRYSDHQFTLYNELWGSLCELKISAEALWKNAGPETLRCFSDQLTSTANSVEKNRLLIEEADYSSLREVFNEFNNFWVGKTRLVDIKPDTELEKYEIETLVSCNNNTKDRFTNILESIAVNFKRQIEGINCLV